MSGLHIEIHDWEHLTAAERDQVLERPPVLRDQALQDAVSDIIRNVRNDGDAALRALTERFDGVALEAFRVSEAEFAEAGKALSASELAAIDLAITNVRRFHEVLEAAIDAAHEPGALVTIGIMPTHPETGYGYIQFEHPSEPPANDKPVAHGVRTFAEKPDMATAERFLDSGDFLWNSGMFIWRADTILDEISHHLPEVRDAFTPLEDVVNTAKEREAVEKSYRRSPSISIDYGVMERADKVYVVPGSFGWSDVGDWRAVYDITEKDTHGNALQGNVIMHDASRCLVQADSRLVVLVGIHDAVVIDTDDALLVGHRESMQQVKNVVEYLHAHQLEDYM